MDRQLIVSLDISAEDYLRYYQGSARTVLARSRDGRTVSFPASLLQRMVTREGVHGEFVLRYDEHNRFISIDRL